MKLFTLIILFLLNVMLAFAIDSTKVKEDANRIEQTSINHSGELLLKSNKKTIFEYIFPSILALVVAGIAHLTTIRTTKKQIDSNRITIKQQIDSTLKIADLDFRKTVLSENRQDWINKHREVVSEILSLCEINLSQTGVDNEKRLKIVYLTTKAELMLNPTKDSDYISTLIKLKDVTVTMNLDNLDSEENLASVIEELKKMAKMTLKKEWERVKNAE